MTHTQLLPLLASLLLSACSGNKSTRILYQPYTIRGIHYTPMTPHQATGFTETGLASWYIEKGTLFNPGPTSLGEPYRSRANAGAHKTLPLPCKIKVENLKNGKKTTIRLNDRGPFIQGRIIDVTPRVAKKLGFHQHGITTVRITLLSVGD